MQRALEVPAPERRGRERLVHERDGENAFEEIEPLLEVKARVDRGAPTHPQEIQRVGRGLPAPPAARPAATRALEVGVPERPTLADRGLHRAQQGRVLLEETRPALVPVAVVEHRPAPRREMRGRDQTRHMGPVLEEHPAAVDQPVERSALVGAEPAPQRQVVGAVHHVDRVELDTARVLGEPGEAGGGQPPGPRPIEMLALQE